MSEFTPMTPEFLEESAPEPEIRYVYDERAVTEIKEEIGVLQDLFTRRLMEDKQKTELIKTLKDAVGYTVVEPFLVDLILLLDRAEQFEDKSFAEELYDILSRRGVEKISTDIDFNPALHKAVRVQESPNVENMQIVQVIRPGYMFSGRVLRPAEVVVIKPIRGVAQ